jgi:hypothetical protein
MLKVNWITRRYIFYTTSGDVLSKITVKHVSFPAVNFRTLHGNVDLGLGLAGISADLQTLPGKNLQKNTLHNLNKT